MVFLSFMAIAASPVPRFVRNASAAAPSAPRVLRLTPKPPPKTLSTPNLDFAELYTFGPRAPELTAKVLALHGKRVTMVGFMVALERPVKGGFFVSPYPASSDESGGGRGDLPPTSVLVLSKGAVGREVAFVPGALEITGILDVGNQEHEGEPSTIRLLVEDTLAVRFARTRRTAKGPRTITEKPKPKQELAGRGPR
jgi:hypothetical protein